MVKIFFLAASLLLAVNTVSLASENNIYEVSPYKITPVKSVSNIKNAVWADNISSDETPKMCADFVLTKNNVREFFRLAKQVSEREYGHDLLMSRCSAEGEIVFANGDRGKWDIDRTRRGLLILSDGRAVYFYCEKCRPKVFVEPCDEKCINGE